jgi:hypothetical protein
VESWSDGVVVDKSVLVVDDAVSEVLVEVSVSLVVSSCARTLGKKRKTAIGPNIGSKFRLSIANVGS